MLSALFDESMECFERSKHQPSAFAARPGSMGMPLPKGNSELIERQVQTRAGDPRFLNQAQGALADIRKIYGLGAPHENFGQTSQAVRRPRGCLSSNPRDHRSRSSV
jgi:hypothetical protein